MEDPRKPLRTKVVLTVDVEASIAEAFSGNPAYAPLIHEPVSGQVGDRSEGLGFLIETLSRHGLTATFFVETIQTRYFFEQIMGHYVEWLLRAGQDIQLHLHPCWLLFRDGPWQGFGRNPHTSPRMADGREPQPEPGVH